MEGKDSNFFLNEDISLEQAKSFVHCTLREFAIIFSPGEYGAFGYLFFEHLRPLKYLSFKD